VKTDAVKIGLFGIGLETYWPQFPKLRERLLGYQAEIAAGSGSSGPICSISG